MTDLSRIEREADWRSILEADRELLDEVLPAYLSRCRWFQSKARRLRGLRIVDTVPMENSAARLFLLNVEYVGGIEEIYLLPVMFITDEDARALHVDLPNAVIAHLRCLHNGVMADGVLIDAVFHDEFRENILRAIATERHMNGEVGAIQAGTTSAFPTLYEPGVDRQSRLMGREQSNTSIRYGSVLILKLMRKLETGINPELEIGRFLTEKTRITHIPLLAGYMEYHKAGQPPMTLAVLQKFVPNEGDAWEYTLNWLGQWLQSGVLEREHQDIPGDSLVALAMGAMPTHTDLLVGEYLEKARLLGQRTAELHIALASGQADAFRPEPFSQAYQASLRESTQSLVDRVFDMLRNRLADLPLAVKDHARAVLEQEQAVRAGFAELGERSFPGMRIRGHGDYHLGQVLYSADDFVIVDFEGEPARPLFERYVKHSPLRDVAGMLRSFHYAAYGALPGFGVQRGLPEEKLGDAEPWVRYWRIWTSVAFLKSYLDLVVPANILPSSLEDIDTLLSILIMEKAVYELGYELNNRPGWLKVPAQAIMRGAN